MRAMSLLRAWIYGISGFIAVTAALTVAMTIAITGPPTDEEIGQVEAFLTRASLGVGEAADDLGQQACANLSPDVTGPLCSQVAPNEPTVPRAPVQPADGPVIVAEAAEPDREIEVRPSNDTALLGDANGDAAHPEAAPRRSPPPDRRPHRSLPSHRVQRMPRPPVVAPSTASAPALPAGPSSALQDLLDARTPELAAPEEDDGLSQYEAMPVSGEADEVKESADDYYDDASADEAELERWYAEQDARLRAREERRAYREWRRRYGGW